MTQLIRGWPKHLTPPVPGWQRTDPLDRGLVGEWRFNPTTGLMLPEYSGYGRHGIISDGDWRVTRWGPALELSSGRYTSYVDCGIQNIFTLASHPLSIEFFLTEWTGLTDRQVIVEEGWNLWVGNSGSAATNVRLHYPLDGKDSGIGYVSATSHTHGVVTFGGAGNDVIFYKDGELFLNAGAMAAPGNPGVGSNLIIGTEHGGDGNYKQLDGTLTIVRLYNRVLSAAEVHARCQICLKRGQPLTHVWTMPWGMSTVAPPVGGHMTLWGRYWGP